jgi:hypothetical protein
MRVAPSNSGPIYRPLAHLYDGGGHVRAVGELEDLGGVARIGCVMLLRDTPDVCVQIVVTLVTLPRSCIRTALQQAGMRRTRTYNPSVNSPMSLFRDPCRHSA